MVSTSTLLALIFTTPIQDDPFIINIAESHLSEQTNYCDGAKQLFPSSTTYIPWHPDGKWASKKEESNTIQQGLRRSQSQGLTKSRC